MDEDGGESEIEAIGGAILRAAERLGVARAEEVQIETLVERLEAEAVALNATVIAPPLIGAWTRVAD